MEANGGTPLPIPLFYFPAKCTHAKSEQHIAAVETGTAISSSTASRPAAPNKPQNPVPRTTHMDLDPPQPQPQLFCCSLLHTLQLQSPPPAMSSSSALFFPRSRAPNVDSATAIISAPAGSRRATGGLAESEFAFLESKPSLLDERVARGKAAGGNGKGRRHAGEAILRRKLANQAFLVKVGSGGGGKELGGGKSGGGRGRRNQRVLSELVADQFAPSVPYSLNRKSRWAQEGADWLTELAGGWNDGPKLRLSLAEADYSLVGTESVRALHRLEMADKGSGRNESRWAKSGRGALLADLARSEEEEVAEERENEEPSEELHFQLTRPNPVSRLFAGKFFKRKQIRYNKRSGGMELSSAGAGGAPMPTNTNRPPVTESEPEEENEFLAQYRPRRETYSLADFVKDSSPPQSQNQQHSSMVIVRRKNANNSNKSAGGAHLRQQDDLNSFAIIPELECIPLPDSPIDFPPNDSPLSSNPSATEECPKQQCPNALSQLRQQLLNAKNGGFFRQFPLALAISGTAQINELATQQPDWHPQWLGTDLLALDLSWTLAKEPETQMLILVLSQGELLVNSLIQLNEQKVAQALEGDGLEQKIRCLLDAVRSDFAEWELSHQHQRTASTHEHLRATFHSPRMSLALQPLSIQSILAQQRAELGREEESHRQQFVGAEELLGTGTKLTSELLDDEEEEEFELIDMDELLGGAVKRDNATNSPMVSTPKCADCSSTKSNAPLAMVLGCGHRCCRECLGNAIEQRELNGAINLHCPICPSQLPLDLLPWVLPLPAVNALILLREAELAIQAGHQLAQCPCCQGILDAGGKDGNLRQFVAEFGQISCNRCALHWCPKCEQASHWPMDCAQNGEWERRIRPNEGTQQQQINGQFAEICTESRARRLDARLGWQLGKHMRRLSDSRTERRFLLARKTALHLLEFGTAWLYLNRQPRPATWNQLKSLLWAIRERVECLDNELLFSGSLTDAETIKAKLADLEQLGEKGLAKFAAALANKGSSGDGIQQ